MSNFKIERNQKEGSFVDKMARENGGGGVSII